MISMTIKELEEKLNSLYDPEMMFFSVEDSSTEPNTVVISKIYPLIGTIHVMYKINLASSNIELTIAYIEGQIAGYKECRQNPDDFAATIKALESIKDFAEERLEKDNE